MYESAGALVFIMRRFLPALILACIAGGAGLYLFLYSSSKRSVSSDALPLNSSPATSTAKADQAAAALAPTPAARPENVLGNSTSAAAALPLPTPFLLGSSDTPPAMDPATVLSNMRIVINHYNSMFGGNPVGSNSEITKALNGGNAKEVKFLNEESGLRINGRGELVDYWGTPFFFHQLSGTEMEIRSAGPDRKMWTADDLVTK